MATVEQLVKQYETDKALQAEVAAIVADGKVSMMEFLAFAKKHDVAISLEDLPKYLEQAKKLGFMKYAFIHKARLTAGLYAVLFQKKQVI